MLASVSMSLYLWVGACTSPGACVEVRGQPWLSSSVTLLGTGRVSGSTVICLVSWPMSFGGFFSLRFPFTPGALAYGCTWSHPALRGFWGSKFGPHIYATSALATEPSLQDSWLLVVDCDSRSSSASISLLSLLAPPFLFIFVFWRQILLGSTGWLWSSCLCLSSTRIVGVC